MTGRAAPDVSVVIPVRNGAATIRGQIMALAGQADAPAFEIIVSDNGSTDGTAELCRELASQVQALRVVDSGDRAGVAHARNVGVSAALGNKIVFCDADDLVSERWLRSFADALDEYDAVGGPVRLDRLNAGDVVRGLPPVSTGLPSVFGYLAYAVGANHGVRRSVFLAVGGNDESFPCGHEEVDFAWRLQHAGYTVGWAPAAIVDYRQRATVRGAFRQFRSYGQSSIQLWARYGPKRPLGPVSFVASIRHAAAQLLAAPKLLVPSRRFSHARSLGWAVGVVLGNVRYRKFGAPPAPRLMDTTR